MDKALYNKICSGQCVYCGMPQAGGVDRIDSSGVYTREHGGASGVQSDEVRRMHSSIIGLKKPEISNTCFLEETPPEVCFTA
jgi:hypothetical protein